MTELLYDHTPPELIGVILDPDETRVFSKPSLTRPFGTVVVVVVVVVFVVVVVVVVVVIVVVVVVVVVVVLVVVVVVDEIQTNPEQ